MYDFPEEKIDEKIAAPLPGRANRLPMKKVACVLKGYPRLSETFIAQELLALEQAGLQLTLVSLRHPTDRKTHPVHKKIRSPVVYLSEYLYQEPVRVLLGLLTALGNPRVWTLLRVFCRDLMRDFTFNRARRLGQAMELARELAPDTDWLYAHFLHTPASVTRYCAILTGLPWSCSAHAKDIWTSPDWEIREKIADMAWLVTCTRTNVEHLRRVSARPEKIALLYHGLDLQRFPLVTAQRDANDGTLSVLSVGRAVPKKGYPRLLEALHELPATVDWRFTHIGTGPQLATLQEQARSLGIAERIRWLGPCDADQVLANYRQADIFVLFSTIDSDGDRDGLPNVIMEAMSQGVVCIATRISGIPEIIEDGVNGLLVEDGDIAAMSAAITRVATDAVLREALSAAAVQTVQQHFSFHDNIGQLVVDFGTTD